MNTNPSVNNDDSSQAPSVSVAGNNEVSQTAVTDFVSSAMQRVRAEHAAALAKHEKFAPGDRVRVVSVPAHGAVGVSVGDMGTFSATTSSTHCNANLVKMDSGAGAAFHSHNITKANA